MSKSSFVKPCKVLIISAAPVPQLAPKAVGGFSRSLIIFTNSCGDIPIMVLPAVSKLIVPHQGRPTNSIALAAA